MHDLHRYPWCPSLDHLVKCITLKSKDINQNNQETVQEPPTVKSARRVLNL